MSILQWLLGKPKRKYKVKDHSRQEREKHHDINVKTMKVGDYITYNSIDYFIREKITLESSGYVWLSYHLSDVDDKQIIWLDVDDDETLEISISKPVKIPEVTLDLLSASQPISYNGRSFIFQEHGFATAKVEKEGEDVSYAKIEYWDYATKDEEELIGIEKWGDNDPEISYGKTVSDYEFEIYPT